MKRTEFNTSESSGSLFDKRNKRQTFYLDEDNSYPLTERTVYYQSNPLNDKIINYAPSVRFVKGYNMVADFEINTEICVFVRRIADYKKNPSEIFDLNKKQPKTTNGSTTNFVLRVFIIILDNTAANTPTIEELSAKCVFENLSLLLCWNTAEAASLINTIKTYEKRGSEIIQKHSNKDLKSKAINVLTNINGINTDNANMLISKYKTMADIMSADLNELSELPGLGNKRVLSLYKAFQQQKHSI